MLASVSAPTSSNRPAIENALNFVCLSGKADETRRKMALKQLAAAEDARHDDDSSARYLLLLSNDARQKFKALYTVSPPEGKETEARGRILLGAGPPRLRAWMVAKVSRCYILITQQRQISNCHLVTQLVWFC